MSNKRKAELALWYHLVEWTIALLTLVLASIGVGWAIYWRKKELVCE